MDVEDMMSYAWHRTMDNTHHQLYAVAEAIETAKHLVQTLYQAAGDYDATLLALGEAEDDLLHFLRNHE
jgi:O-succinylbenzoate synthase